ncbi:MAG: hypothetical protein WBA97_20640 [Actinophytocola sp.]|uniref:hypothetical protein n=1 Tax=Actinophytocola sp. TaxID=1872138 RepID=UPI003C795428
MSDGRELVPLSTGFDIVMRGYRRGPVRQYVHAVEEELRLLVADRDANAELAQALVAEVELLRARNGKLARQVDEMSRMPVDPAAVPARLRKMVELAKEEAGEITARAQAAAENSWAAAEEAAGRLRARYEKALVEMDRTRRVTEEEHRQLLHQARVDAAVMTTQADRRRAELDELASRRRERVVADFEVAMARRRGEAMREIAMQRIAAQTEADRLVSVATKDADRRVATSRERASRLMREATESAENRTAAAKAEATHRIREATAEAERLVSEATTEAESRTTAAKAEAERLVREATEAAARRAATSRERASRLMREATESAEARAAAAKAEANRRIRVATAEAGSLVSTATEESHRRVTVATQEVVRLRDLRGRLATQLASAREVLGSAVPLLAPTEVEALEEPARQSAIPQQRSSG